MVALHPDYLGFIFYAPSARNIEIEALPEGVKNILKVGVFVDAPLEFINEKIKRYDLKIIQLHGNETPEFCKEIKKIGLEIWKVFSVKDSFDFEKLSPYENIVDAFLFDTKGVQKGGNGLVFDWSILERYPSKKPIILSGGIGLDEVSSLQKIKQSGLPIMAVDINSRFEKKAGVKDRLKIETFIKAMRCGF